LHSVAGPLARKAAAQPEGCLLSGCFNAIFLLDRSDFTFSFS
jgi:hypothetical protein